MAFLSESLAAYKPTFLNPSDPESPSIAESTSPSSVPASSPTALINYDSLSLFPNARVPPKLKIPTLGELVHHSTKKLSLV